MLDKLLPYRLHLQIFQQDEYSVNKFLQWIITHFLTRTIENKKPLVWTPKARSIFYLAILLAFLLVLFATIIFKLNGFIASLIVSSQAYIFILLAYFILLPLEIYKKNQIKNQTRKKIESLKNKGLKIIGITGSYGKTSTKEFLYQILRTKYKVLKTPESYNTPQGIAKVVDLELDDSYEYFICEMGAYRVGDIKKICDMVHPNYGILTGINEQHLETFGSLENTTKGKFELIDSVKEDGKGIVNANNERIKDEYEEYYKQYKNISIYEPDKKFYFNNDGTTFRLFIRGEYHTAKTKLLGIANVENITAASTMSSVLKVETKDILRAIEKLVPVPHRVEFKPQKDMIIIDDAYNSNVDGFKNAIDVLSMYDVTILNRTRILVTPGIVDLGKETLKIHRELGELISDKAIGFIQYVLLVGKSDRTRGLKEGIKNKDIDKKIEIIEVDSIKDVWKEIEKLKLDHPVVLLENDLPDNY